MSYRPGNAHFTDSVRPSANGSWVNSKLSGQNGHTGGGIGQKLEGFLDNRQLPMYKDKPYSYVASGRKPALYKRWQIILGAALILTGLSYWLGVLPFFGGKRRIISPGKVGLGGSALGLTATDWGDRREEVKQVFIKSWDGYEKYAWGKPKTVQSLRSYESAFWANSPVEGLGLSCTAS